MKTLPPQKSSSAADKLASADAALDLGLHFGRCGRRGQFVEGSRTQTCHCGKSTGVVLGDIDEPICRGLAHIELGLDPRQEQARHGLALPTQGVTDVDDILSTEDVFSSGK
jgi:hypothetical protein